MLIAILKSTQISQGQKMPLVDGKGSFELGDFDGTGLRKMQKVKITFSSTGRKGLCHRQ